MTIQLDDRYMNYPIYAQKIETKKDNIYFTDGDIAIQIYIANHDKFLDILEDGDFVVMKGGAGTKNNFHVVKLSIKDDTVYFEATSDFLSDIPCKQILLEDIQQAPIYSKILFTISNRMNQSMVIDFFGIPRQHSNIDNQTVNEAINFGISFPSERNK
ncbi:hypothetical protein ACVRW4_01900 [Streptococcus phocae subsp. phocae]